MQRLCLLLLVLISFQAQADLTIEISGGALQQIPIANVSFSQPANMAPKQDTFTSIIDADLRRSGLFKVLETKAMESQPHTIDEVRYPEWAALQAQALTIGKIEQSAGNRLRYRLNCSMWSSKPSWRGKTMTLRPINCAWTAHKIAYIIFQKLTGQPGVFSTRISYVSKVGKRFSLYVADADGFNPQTIVSSSEPIISPAWSPEGDKLAYVSFEKKKPVIFVQSLVSGQRMVLANFKGNNSAPSWSPDGKKLAIVLTYGSNSQLYTINSDGTGLKQILKSSSIDTEPVWSPDGSRIYFTSDRGGSPQIYKVGVNGENAQRVTFDGAYNVSPRISPDGRFLAFIKRDGGQFRVATQDLSSGQVQILSATNRDESPSFAPNGRMILYATNLGGKGTLAAVSADGQVKQRLKDTGGDVREPAWGPVLN